MSARRCSARSKQSGQRCRRAPFPGAVVCKMHGAGSPKVQASARERLLALVDPSITRLAQLVRHGRPDAVALGAARDVLDRAGLARPAKVELSGRIELDALRDRLAGLGEGRASRLAELLQRAVSCGLSDDERAELSELQRAAGLEEGP